MTPTFRVSISEYVQGKRPSNTVGDKVDATIRQHFLGRKVAIRALRSQEHDKTRAELIMIIKRLGHDRYDPNRKGDRYENVQNRKIDIFCLEKNVGLRNSLTQQIIDSFYEWPPHFGRPPIRCDLFLIYDRSKLRQVSHRYEGRDDTKIDGFVFKDPDNKPKALLGIIEIE